jgi:hypothetical protein
MIKQIVLLVCLAGSALVSRAKDGDYAVAKINPALLKNANAVLRLEELRVEIINPGKLRYSNHYVITILNEAGDRWAAFHEYYDKFQKIESAEGVLYSAEGKQLKKVKTKDMMDVSGVSDGSLIDDNRVKHHNFYHRLYPYTVEYTVEIECNGTLFFPGWRPQGAEKLSVENSSIAMIASPSYVYRYKTFNYSKEPVRVSEKDKVTSTWSVKDLPAITREPYSPEWHELVPMAIFGPSEFEMDNYKGNMSSWDEFGKFVYALKRNRDELPEPVKQKVQQLLAGVSSEEKKIAILYDYLQKNTRYISIQLGIGGWQPFDAKFVSAKGYGDCKALTNYMYSLLKEGGIRSHYALIRAGRGDGYIDADFPSSQFNHVILCVPGKKDTTWLECTSQTLPTGYLSDFTADRYALLVEESGSKLVRTPRYGLKENLQKRSVNANLKPDGTLDLKIVTNYSGLQQDYIHELINHLSKDKIKEYLNEQLEFSTFEIAQFNYHEHKNALPVIEETLELSVSNYATITGKRLFIIPNVMTRTNRKLEADESRKQDIVLESDYVDVDSVQIQLPEGYSAESLPQDLIVESKFGRYRNSVRLNGNVLKYYRMIESYAGRFPASDYAAFVKFRETVYKADRSKVVLIKPETTKGF